MMHKYFIFTDPKDARGELKSDFWDSLIVAQPDTHPTGRLGQSFSLPSDFPNGVGARLLITAKGRVSVDLRGVLWLKDDGLAGLEVDDFQLQPGGSLPRLVRDGQFLAQDIPG